MRAIMITSSVLIAVILLLRWLFRGKVSQRLIYGAWLLVAVRLLIPIQFGQFEYSIATLTDTIEVQSVAIQQAQIAFREPVSGPSREKLYQQLLDEYRQQNATPVTPEIQEQIKSEAAKQISAPSMSDIFAAVWIGGMVIMGIWFLMANIRFLRHAETGAKPFPCEAPVRVRLSSNVSSPCLVGLLRPVIYLTPASIESPQSLKHILTHEVTHLRHWDHIWSVARCVCLCVYWFNPLVWAAAVLSKRDCELACDESVLKKLGDSERIAYGKNLLATISQNSIRVFEAAAYMAESKKQLKQRIHFIIKKPKNLLIAVICLYLVIAITVGCTFTGSKVMAHSLYDAVTEPAASLLPPTERSTSAIDAPFSTSSGWYRMALTSTYYDAKNLDLSLFFANGTEDATTLTDGEWDALKDIPGFERNDSLRRLPVSRMNAILTECFGLTLSEMNGVGLDKMIYLKSTDCYYFMSPCITTVPGFTIIEQSNSWFIYTDKSGNVRQVFFAAHSDGYHIIRNILYQADHMERTAYLARKYFDMSRAEFLYASNSLVLDCLEARKKQMEANGLSPVLEPGTIKDRSLFVSNFSLILSFHFSIDEQGQNSPNARMDTILSREDLSREQFENLTLDTYRWLFDAENQTNAFGSITHTVLMMEAFFQEPDLFLEILSEQDEAAIRHFSIEFHRTFASQAEYDLYTQLLLTISARTDLTAAEARAVTLLAETIPEDFPYKAAANEQSGRCEF